MIDYIKNKKILYTIQGLELLFFILLIFPNTYMYIYVLFLCIIILLIYFLFIPRLFNFQNLKLTKHIIIFISLLNIILLLIFAFNFADCSFFYHSSFRYCKWIITEPYQIFNVSYFIILLLILQILKILIINFKEISKILIYIYLYIIIILNIFFIWNDFSHTNIIYQIKLLENGNTRQIISSANYMGDHKVIDAIPFLMKNINNENSDKWEKEPKGGSINVSCVITYELNQITNLNKGDTCYKYNQEKNKDNKFIKQKWEDWYENEYPEWRKNFE